MTWGGGRLALVLALMALAAGPGWARGERPSSLSDTDVEEPQIDRSAVTEKERSKALELTRTIPSPMAQAGPVDPAQYVLGPGDVLQLDLWGRLMRSVPLEVSPEGKIFLPENGPIDVRGRTLAWARDRILQLVADTFRGVHADVRLAHLRTFKVFLTGFVTRPGAVEATSVARASEAVSGVGIAENGSRRNIEVRHRDGSTQRLDLEMFEAAGRQDLNPMLVDGDVIYVPRAVEWISVIGAVARPLRFEHAPGDSLSTLLQLAGGLIPAADSGRALMVRFVGASQRESLWVNLGNPGDDPGVMSLRDGDNLFVQFRSEYHVLRSVGIYGEVERPGTYPIVLGRDRFGDLIRWAGGFLPLADRSGIHLLREPPAESEKDPEFDRLVRLSRSEMTESEYAKFQTRLAERKNSFRIDWSRLQKESADIDPLLQDGDVARVDQLVSSVRVEGEVRRPGFIDFVPGRTLNEYVTLSGGFTDRAQRRAVRVSRSHTGQVIPAASLKSVQPGDFIWVPERRDVDAWAVFRDVVTVAGQVAVIIFTLTR